MIYKWLVGVDEAGRGPLAGPVSVGVAVVTKEFDWQQLPRVNDSKKLTEEKREAIFLLAQKLKKEGKLDWQVSMVSAKIIDKKGIVFAIRTAMVRALSRTELPPSHCKVLLDGSLYAPEEYKNQKTIIKGDGKEKVIGLASILAKVTRDRYMVRIAKKSQFAPYTFAQHKGYGTKMHREDIVKYGVSKIHRKTFCRGLLK